MTKKWTKWILLAGAVLGVGLGAMMGGVVGVLLGGAAGTVGAFVVVLLKVVEKAKPWPWAPRSEALKIGAMTGAFWGGAASLALSPLYFCENWPAWIVFLLCPAGMSLVNAAWKAGRIWNKTQADYAAEEEAAREAERVRKKEELASSSYKCAHCHGKVLREFSRCPSCGCLLRDVVLCERCRDPIKDGVPHTCRF